MRALSRFPFVLNRIFLHIRGMQREVRVALSPIFVQVQYNVVLNCLIKLKIDFVSRFGLGLLGEIWLPYLDSEQQSQMQQVLQLWNGTQRRRLVHVAVGQVHESNHLHSRPLSMGDKICLSAFCFSCCVILRHTPFALQPSSVLHDSTDCVMRNNSAYFIRKHCVYQEKLKKLYEISNPLVPHALLRGNCLCYQ